VFCGDVGRYGFASDSIEMTDALSENCRKEWNQLYFVAGHVG
jgi:hypothetical protein